MKPPTFRTIIADPDWQYDNFGAAKHGAARAHYAGSPVDAIACVPVRRWARTNSLLLLWATLPKLDQAIDVMRSWGFSLVTAVPWVKTSPKAGTIKRGIGFWFYATSEVLLVCRRGKTRAPRQTGAEKPMGLLVSDLRVMGVDPERNNGGDERGSPVFYAPRGVHSRKPLSLIEWVEAKLPGPYLELYARVDRPGWTCWGHDTGWHLDASGVSPKANEEAKTC